MEPGSPHGAELPGFRLSSVGKEPTVPRPTESSGGYNDSGSPTLWEILSAVSGQTDGRTVVFLAVESPSPFLVL